MRTASVLLLAFVGIFECRLLAAQTARTPLEDARTSLLRGARPKDLTAACNTFAAGCGSSFAFANFGCFDSSSNVYGDFYATSMVVGQTLTATASSTSSTDIAVSILDTAGNPVATSTAGTVVSTSYTATVAGVYTVYVFSGSNNGYTLTLTCLAGPGGCTSAPGTLCLNNGRFSVTATWQTSTGSGTGTAVPLTNDTGYFWFFSPSNVEMVTKVLNACGLNSHYWVFAGGLTNVDVVWTVTDTGTDTSVVFENPANTAFQPIQDTSAFATCP
jgi:hypothetical protein